MENNFCLFAQKIENLSDKSDVSYELLLRSGSANKFPLQEFSKIVVDRKQHQEYTRWLGRLLSTILTKYPEYSFSFNLDHQELEYEDTFEMLEKLIKFNKRLIVEITEIVPILRNTAYFTQLNYEAFQRIKDMGLKIALDDVGQGMNSLGNLLQLLDKIDRIKFSTLIFHRKIEEVYLKKFLIFIADIAYMAKKELVVEGIEDSIFSNWVNDNITPLHQGYYYSMPDDVWKIEV